MSLQQRQWSACDNIKSNTLHGICRRTPAVVAMRYRKIRQGTSLPKPNGTEQERSPWSWARLMLRIAQGAQQDAPLYRAYLHIPVYQGKPNRGAGTPVVSRSVPEHAIHAVAYAVAEGAQGEVDVLDGTACHDVVDCCLPQSDNRCRN